MTLAIFNPEHDLCLANGRAHYVPPRSAIDFARREAGLMQVLYPDAHCCSVYDLSDVNLQSSIIDSVVAWGWDLRLKRLLQKHGCPDKLLPSDESLETLRQLQHRSTIVALQPHAFCATSIDEILKTASDMGNPQLVLKAPWSGAGRGVRFVDGTLSEHDRRWAEKVIAVQRCVMVERRLRVRDEYAIEYRVDADVARQTGLSLFVSQGGVYRQNILIRDDEIRKRVSLQPETEELLMKWITEHIVGRYVGPLGVDLILDTSGNTHVSEFNFRHTMGMVAHEQVNSE